MKMLDAVDRYGHYIAVVGGQLVVWLTVSACESKGRRFDTRLHQLSD